MKIILPGFSLIRGTSGAVALTISILCAAFLGGVSVQAASTNYYWNVLSPDNYTNDADWATGVAPMGLMNIAPSGSVNYVGFITNGGTINYGDGGNGSATGYTWTNALGGLLIGTNGNGTFSMSSGSLVVSNAGGNDFVLGAGNPSVGSLTLNGGSLTAVRDAATFFQDFLIVGNALNASATLTINGGVLTSLAGIEVGNGGAGTVTVNGGVLVDNGWFGIGRGGATGNSSGTFNLSGGIVYILRNQGNDTSGADNGLYLGQGSTNLSVANISGGTLYGVGIGMGGAGAQSSQALNISGGTIYVGYRGVSTGTGTQLGTISGGIIHTLNMVTNNAANMGATNSSTILADGTNWTWGAAATVNLTNSSFTVNGSSGPGYVTFMPEATRTITLNNKWVGVGGMVINGPGTIALGGANTYTGGTTISQGNLTLNTGGSVADSTLTIPSGSTLTFNNTGTATFTNIVVGAGKVVLANSGLVNVGNNLQNTGTISQNNGILVVNGSILNASVLTNNSPATVGPLIAQGNITPPIGIGTNSSIEMGTSTFPGTLNASNVILNGTWIEKINTATTVGGGVNDLLICSNLTLNPSSVLNIAPLSAPSVGTYVIAQYSGTLTGTFGTLINLTRDAMTLDYSTPGEILLHVNSSNPASLVWSATNFQANINWDVNTSSNWTNTATSALDKFQQQDAVTFSAISGSGITNRVAIVGQLLPSSITISGGLPYLFSGTGSIGGATGINDTDTNTVGIFTAGNNYTGTVNINAGVLQLGSGGSGWLGATNGPTVVNGGTLDLNAQSVGAEPLIIQGSGGGLAGTNGGAINNSASTSPNQSGGPLNVTLTGDTTLNASGARWDIGINTLGAGGGSFTGNGHNLVKIGNQAVWMHEVGDIGVGNIDIQQGLLGFEFTVGMGIPGDTVTVEPGATLGIFSLNTNSILNKQLMLNGNATVQSGGNAGASNNFVGPITLVGTNSIQTSSFPLNLPNVINGTGGFLLTGTGPLYLGSADIYSGPTFIGVGSRLILGPAASIANTPLIYLVPSINTVLDDGANAFTLNNGQTLVGAGSITATNFTANAGSTISPGTNLAIGTLQFTNNLTLNGGTNIFKIQDTTVPPVANDLLNVVGNLNVTAPSTIEVIPLVALQSSQPYAIMQVNGTITGTGNLHVISSSPRYTMALSVNPPFVEVTPSGNSANLVWKGNLSSIWNFGTSNWFNLATASSDSFFNGDNPIFDDSSAVNTVTITNSILPAGIFMSNVVKSYTFNGAGVAGGMLNMEGNGSGQGGSLILATTNAPAFTSINADAGTLVYNLQGLTNYTVNSVFTDNSGARQGTIIFGGTNTAVLTADNYDALFDETFYVTNGVFQYTNQDVFGQTSVPVVSTNTGTLDINGVLIGGAYNVHISGVGFKGMGALTDSKGNQEPNGGFCNLTLDNDTTIGLASTRLDQHVLVPPTEQVNGNGYNLTFTGGGALFFNPQGDGDTHFGNIDVASTNGGRLAFQGGPLALGLTDHYLFLETNATVTFFSISNSLDPVHAGIDKIMWMKGSAVLDTGGSSNNYIGPVFLTGTNLFGLRSDIHLWNTIMDTNGPGGFIMALSPVNTGNGNLWLDGTNSYSGATILSNNTVHVGVNSSLGLSRYVRVNSGATLDLSAMPVFNFGTVATNQFMTGNGLIVGPATGNININAGGTLAVGSPLTNNFVNTNAFTMTISNTLVFNSGSTYYVGVNKTSALAVTNASDHVVGLTSVTMGGTLIVTNYGRSFVGGDVIPLFSSAAYVATGFTSNNIVPTTPGANLAWDTSTLGADGNLRVFSTLTVNPQPTNIVFSVSGGQLTLSWPADHIGWELQVQTNGLAVGISTNWTPIPSSTTVNSVVIPINLTNGSVFYRMVYPPQ